MSLLNFNHEKCVTSKHRLDAELQGARTYIEHLEKQSLPLFEIERSKLQVTKITDTATTIRKEFHDVVFLGTGGSTLSGQAITGIKTTYASLNVPRIHFVDNIDPSSIHSLLSSLAPSSTLIVVISKSGSTLETAAQLVYFASWIQRNKLSLAKHFMFISDPKSSPLRQFAKSHSILVLDHEVDIGGRFSVFTNVGLLPAAIAGMDVDALLSGAHECVTNFFKVREKSDACLGVFLQKIAIEEGLNETVLMCYNNALSKFGIWFRQIWAESLGKNGYGSTPIPATGTLDQHSQLQLYLEGPRNKFFTFVTVQSQTHLDLPSVDVSNELMVPFLSKQPLDNVLNACAISTIESLAKKGLPVRHLHINTLNEKTLGAMMMHFIIETILLASIKGINPFDQPAVEDSKRMTLDILRSIENA